MSETKLIPVRHAAIFWNDDPARRHRAGGPDVLVLDVRQGHADPEKLSCSGGAVSADWVVGSHALDQPAGLFASVWLRRDASPDAIRAALVQFGQIDECHWAREMLAAFDYVDGLD